eukprot:CAMPEP_0176269398 /NCGR_PEP_ID=MMETSP0121_2-20121125/44170_1 /TAXON_ID=160619 /ORGANISM="Kryptoperidinium foliaceum, Strain CCMP 1326" /LENGTH=86 /DNA_ID=CAMNT_0017609523 /DNA_START=229 /DNA_END=485 /DNA_ORIENTATION=+
MSSGPEFSCRRDQNVATSSSRQATAPSSSRKTPRTLPPGAEESELPYCSRATYTVSAMTRAIAQGAGPTAAWRDLRDLRVRRVGQG